MKIATKDHLDFKGLKILRRSTAQMVVLIDEHIKSATALSIAFCNANTLLLANDNPKYHNTLQAMTLLNDGVGVDLAAKILGEPKFEENLNGTDFIPAILSQIAPGAQIYLLGAKPEIVEKAAENLETKFPQHKICGFQHGYFATSETQTILKKMNHAKADIVLVAMGNPMQESFIVEHRNSIKAPIVLGVGAFLDFTAQVVPRAPLWVRKLKCEWLYRLAQEPRRLLHRYTIGIVRFLWLCAKLRWQARGHA